MRVFLGENKLKFVWEGCKESAFPFAHCWDMLDMCLSKNQLVGSIHCSAQLKAPHCSPVKLRLVCGFRLQRNSALVKPSNHWQIQKGLSCSSSKPYKDMVQKWWCNAHLLHGCHQVHEWSCLVFCFLFVFASVCVTWKLTTAQHKRGLTQRILAEPLSISTLSCRSFWKLRFILQQLWRHLVFWCNESSPPLVLILDCQQIILSPLSFHEGSIPLLSEFVHSSFLGSQWRCPFFWDGTSKRRRKQEVPQENPH